MGITIKDLTAELKACGIKVTTAKVVKAVAKIQRLGKDDKMPTASTLLSDYVANKVRQEASWWKTQQTATPAGLRAAEASLRATETSLRTGVRARSARERDIDDWQAEESGRWS